MRCVFVEAGRDDLLVDQSLRHEITEEEFDEAVQLGDLSASWTGVCTPPSRTGPPETINPGEVRVHCQDAW